MELGIQSPAFRKILYRVACLSEFVFGDDGLTVLQGLMGENLTYGPYNTALRKMYFRHHDAEEELDLQEGEDSPADGGQEDGSMALVKLFEDRDINDADFLGRLREEQDAHRSEALARYKKYVREMEFEEPHS